MYLDSFQKLTKYDRKNLKFHTSIKFIIVTNYTMCACLLKSDEQLRNVLIKIISPHLLLNDH